MKITNQFTVDAPIERAWLVLTDLDLVAPCLPGAQLTGRDGDDYLGRIKVKVGPVVAEFKGTARFSEQDQSRHRAVIDASGRDARGSGNAAALITATLTESESGTGTVVGVETDLKITGKLAQFGNNMIEQVSGKLLGQFATCVESKMLGEPAAPEPAAPEPAAPVTPAAGGSASPGGAPASTAPAAIASSATAPGDRTDAAEPEPLDLMQFAGGAVARQLAPVALGAVIASVIWILVGRRRREKSCRNC